MSMRSPEKLMSSGVRSMKLAAQGLRTWTPRQFLAAVVATVVFGLILGIATVLIPNSLFARDIPPVWWDYPVWILTSISSGMLIATYVRSVNPAQNEVKPASSAEDSAEKRTSRFGIAGGMLAWFAVGCPVCNKFALLALGYSGAITWFAPIQPFLAVGALVLSTSALIWRLRGQVACPISTKQKELVA